MFSNALVGLVMAIGVAGWVYAKTMRSTGNNTKSAITVAGIAGLFAFIILVAILGSIT